MPRTDIEFSTEGKGYPLLTKILNRTILALSVGAMFGNTDDHLERFAC